MLKSDQIQPPLCILFLIWFDWFDLGMESCKCDLLRSAWNTAQLSTWHYTAVCCHPSASLPLPGPGVTGFKNPDPGPTFNQTLGSAIRDILTDAPTNIYSTF